MNELKNKKLLIISGFILFTVILIIALAFLWRQRLKSLKSKNLKLQSVVTNVHKHRLLPPSFLTITEKKKLRISPNIKAQVLKRNSQGAVMVYKIIKSKQDIIYNSSSIKPLLPDSQK